MSDTLDSNISGKYKCLLDQDIQNFINETISLYPSNATSLSIKQQRGYYDAMCSHFAADLPDEISFKDIQLCHTNNNNESSIQTDSSDTITVRLYSQHATDKQEANAHTPLIVYFHGGGFIVGDLESHHDICAEIASQTGIDVLSVDYRLAPEHYHPAAFEDACLAIQYAKEISNTIILCGDSAGANLCAAVSTTMPKLRTCICGQLLIYPGLDIYRNNASYEEHAFAPMLTAQEVGYYMQLRLPVELYESMANSTSMGFDTKTSRSKLTSKQQNLLTSAAPLLATDFAHLPPTVCFAAECDPLRDDSKVYCEAIIKHGGIARLHVEQGLVHGYLRARHRSEKACNSFEKIISTINDLAENNIQIEPINKTDASP